MATETEWAWAAGLFEGEGFILHHPNGKGYTQRRLGINMCDADVLHRFRKIVGVGSEVAFAREATETHRALWRWNCNRWPEIEMVLRRFLPYLGERRTEKALALLADPAKVVNGEKTHCPHGHPYSGDNLKVRIKGGTPRRECRTCIREQSNRRYHARKAA